MTLLTREKRITNGPAASTCSTHGFVVAVSQEVSAVTRLLGPAAAPDIQEFIADDICFCVASSIGLFFVVLLLAAVPALLGTAAGLKLTSTKKTAALRFSPCWRFSASVAWRRLAVQPGFASTNLLKSRQHGWVRCIEGLRSSMVVASLGALERSALNADLLVSKVHQFRTYTFQRKRAPGPRLTRLRGAGFF
jgi:hypothetical protein